MTPALQNAELPDRVYRLGRVPDPWDWPDWSYAIPDGTFGNRFDDPGRQYRVLYASAQRPSANVLPAFARTPLSWSPRTVVGFVAEQ